MTTPARDTVRSNYRRMEAAVEPRATVMQILEMVREYGEKMYDAGYAKDVEARLMARVRAEADHRAIHDALAALEGR